MNTLISYIDKNVWSSICGNMNIYVRIRHRSKMSKEKIQVVKYFINYGNI